MDNNKGLLYSTGNSAQCYVAAWVGGEFGGEWMCGYVWLSLFYCLPETKRTLLTDYNPIQNTQFKTNKQVHVVNLSWSKLLKN